MLRINLEKFLVGLLIISAILGYTVSYQKLYLFHIVAVLYYVAVCLGFIKLSKRALKSISLFFVIFIYAAISLLWTPNIINGLYYLFYLACGLTLLIAITNYAQDREKLYFIFKVAAVMLLLNFFVGLLETTGHFRLLGSAYALPGTFSNITPGFSRPSGFNGNLNNFGFVFAISFPFLFLYPKRIVSFFSILLLIWFTYKLQSKGFFLGILVFFTAYFIFEIKRKSILSIFFFGLLLSTVVGVVYTEEIVSLFQGRIFTLFGQISRGIDLIISGEVVPGDSTATRAYFYSKGIAELCKTYGLGLGVGGITSILELEEGIPIAFHSFFLELLIDLGIFFFLLVIFLYTGLIVKLIKIAKKSTAWSKYIIKSSAYSLILIFPASISPSSIIYILLLWVVLGFIISLSNIMKLFYE